MTGPKRDSHNEIVSSLDLTASEDLPNLDHVVYADDQDPSILTDAGLVALYHVRFLERLYVQERMLEMLYLVRRMIEGRIPTLVPGQISPNAEHATHHEGAACAVLVTAAHSPAYGHWRDGSRLYLIAVRFLLGRAKTRLAQDPTDAEALAVLRYTRETLRRDPGTGMPAAQ